MTDRRPGQWPVEQPANLDKIEKGYSLTSTPGEDELYMQRAAERALHEMVMDSIRHDLQQQPSTLSVLSAARHWCERITATADEIARTKRRTA
ncbi:hypothetical protein [Streptomyces spectabilis]|uniref:Uncharacterized protein n=1 Tax=Streptomyces spectabilis TaxID=68270 RepID=A0A5P2XBF7_STRST|nr:hypothetical protein [Streptomyces spectabilis]MBB5103256.1 hypothetical protein [Streptomyces spectabilis]MCI3902448.1 hypothetical protein [Streptomyces spectabilis]QEV59792.1 hypothetical protein CP982_14470 [Streptomyces spectabilis]GGV13821.1 hypothetical protein GCM10010245_24080 [Streptomyces spectabilis]